jgi:hypothetical protein
VAFGAPLNSGYLLRVKVRWQNKSTFEGGFFDDLEDASAVRARDRPGGAHLTQDLSTPAAGRSAAHPAFYACDLDILASHALFAVRQRRA